MHKIIVAGSGTDVGKTVVSAILTTLLEGDYWKPVECGHGEESDTATMKKLIDTSRHRIYPSAYSFQAALSPHQAARLENISINLDCIVPPLTTRTLIIESAGGIFVPLSTKALSIDLFKSWESTWIIVSKHYLGSINHTLLTLDALKRQNISVMGLIFNGVANPDSEGAILEFSKLPLLGRLLPETNLNAQTIQRYAKQWKPKLSQLIP